MKLPVYQDDLLECAHVDKIRELLKTWKGQANKKLQEITQHTEVNQTNLVYTLTKFLCIQNYTFFKRVLILIFLVIF